ncbi:hypothetical protein QJQ45_029678 [Haematococcus lacustris]|nr:hypothetical protein QJQ45_029678 [Haematococcus lacustris]
MQSITWHCNDKGCSNFDILQRATTQPASVLIGDVADEVGAECVVVSSQTVHSKLVDANQLAEFWPRVLLQLALPFGPLPFGRNAALNMQRIGESKWRPLELCWWPEQGKLPAKGKEYHGLGYKRLRDKPPTAQQKQPPL